MPALLWKWSCDQGIPPPAAPPSSGAAHGGMEPSSGNGCAGLALLAIKVVVKTTLEKST